VAKALFTIPGDPVGKGRPRFSRGRVYTPEKTKAFERLVAFHAQGFGILRGPVKLTISSVFLVPKSWPKRRQKEAMGRYHVVRPDIDNLVKAVADGLNGVLLEDDRQIAVVEARKTYGPQPMTTVIVEELEWWRDYETGEAAYGRK